MDSFVRTEQVHKRYNPGRADEVHAVRGVSLEIPAGQVTVFKGPSGSGKTSLLSLVGCMSRPTAGRVQVQGRDVAKLPERFLTAVRRDTFGFIFQQFHLIRGLTAVENVALPLYPLPVSPGENRARAVHALERLGLGHKCEARAGNLSGGEQQRVAIARALINDPAAVVADEPTAHLDSALAEVLIGILRDLNREGKTVIIATHDFQVFDHAFVHRVVELRDGQVTAVVER